MKLNAIILAGQRTNGDPVAQAEGLPHKGLIEIAGKAMITRVVEALRHLTHLQGLYLLGDEPQLLKKVENAGIKPLSTASSPALSVIKAIHEIGLEMPLLVTTSDHPLLGPKMVDYFINHISADTDMAIGLAPAELVEKAYPGAIRTFYRFGDKRYCGCNLFLIACPEAERVIAFWRQMESMRKKPWRIAAKIGPGILIRYLFKRLTLEQLFAHMSKLTGARITPVILPFAEAAIDVDRLEDLVLVRKILETHH